MKMYESELPIRTWMAKNWCLILHLVGRLVAGGLVPRSRVRPSDWNCGTGRIVTAYTRHYARGNIPTQPQVLVPVGTTGGARVR